MSRLRKEKTQHDVHYIRIQDVETGTFQVLPVLHVMKDYDRVLANEETRPFVMSDFFFESGEPLPHVNVGMASKLGSWAAKAKKKAKDMGKKAKKKAKDMKEKAKKALEDAKESYNEEMKEESDATQTVTLTY